MSDIITATVKETIRLRCEESGASGQVFDTEPTPQEVADRFLAKGLIYPYDQKHETHAQAILEDGKWHGSVYQWNWTNAVREVTLRIPRDQLPAEYTDADVIAWGKELGKTNRKALSDGACVVVAVQAEAKQPPGVPLGMVPAAPRAPVVPVPRTLRTKLAALGGSIADLFRRA